MISAQTRFGHLTVTDTPPQRVQKGDKTRLFYLCVCDCGSTNWVRSDYLVGGDAQSCGCKRTKLAIENRAVKKGDIIGRMMVLFPAPKKRENGVVHHYYNCLCNCGEEFVARAKDVQAREVKHCGCGASHKMAGGPSGKQQKRHRLYDIWSNFRTGKSRHVKCCKEWQLFINFYRWAIEAGWKEGLYFGRIDKSKPFEPSNCRFSTAAFHATDFGTAFGQRKSLHDWAAEYGVTTQTIKRRIRRGMTLEEALTVTPMVHQVKPGMRFGRWLITGEVFRAPQGPSQSLQYFVPATCACGAQRNVGPRALIEGRSLSCGCEKGGPWSKRKHIGPPPEPKPKREPKKYVSNFVARYKNITVGMVFGDLTVIEPASKDDKTATLRCSCGNTKRISIYKLTNYRKGTPLACGSKGKHKPSLSVPATVLSSGEGVAYA